jgi:hypothetical protein
MAKFLVRIEGVNLRNFVEDTQDLNTIRGGGLILLDAIEKIQRKFPLLKKISTGASSGLFEFEATDQEVTKIRSSIDDLLKRDPELKHATIVCDLVRETEDFPHDKESLLALNRWRQMRSPSLAIPNPKNTNRGICSIDHLRPATSLYVTPEQSTEPISRSVKIRRKCGQLRKTTFYQKLLNEGWTDTTSFTLDFDALTSYAIDKRAHNLHHKMAVIYIDGNGFGKIQQEHCRTPEALRAFDAQVQSDRRDFLRELLREMSGIPEKDADTYRWKTVDDNLRIETLLWGGDEIVWAVPAWNGWRTLRLFYQKSKDWQFNQVPLRHAAGIVFCHHNAPIHRIRQLAQTIAELAKERDRESNLFAYEVLESFDHVSGDLDSYRRRRSPRGSNAPALILDGTRMATVEGLAPGLLEKLSRRQLHRLVRLIIGSEPPDDNEVKKTIGNLTAELTTEQRSQLDELRAALGDGEVSWLHLSALWDYLA